MITIKQLKEIIRDPTNNPVLIDTNIISHAGENDNGLLKFLKTKRIEEILPCELKKFSKYLSFVWTAVSGEEKVITIKEIVRETRDSLFQLRDIYERRRDSYESTVKDALMAKTGSSRKEVAGTLNTLSKLNRYVSRLEKTIEILELRSRRYKTCNFLEEITKRVSAVIEKHKGKLTISKISYADIGLVSAAFYEALSHDSSPAVVSNDKHAVIIANYSTATTDFFPPTISEKLKERVKIYWNGEKSFP